MVTCIENQRTGDKAVSNAETHVDIFCQKLVGELVLLDQIGIDTGAGDRASEEKAEETRWLSRSAREPYIERLPRRSKLR